MATIRSQMVLNDGMTSVLRKISGALHTTLDAFEQMQRASGQSINSAQFAAARSQLVGVNAELDEMASNFQQAGSKADGLMGKISGIAAGLASAAMVQKLVNLSDDVTSTQARLNLLVSDGGSVTELEDKIMASANRSRSAYLDTASAVAKLGLNAGNAFDHDMDQVIAFMEQVNKQFVIGGATAQEQSNAMVQLTQAMAAGALRGEELNSILDSAPGIARAIEQYMGVAEGSIKEYAAEGLVTANVVKNALFSVAKETDKAFNDMPMTWAQVWTNMQNKALTVLEPILNKINEIVNSDQLNTAIDTATKGLVVVSTVAGSILGFVAGVGAGIVDNWAVIEPLVWAVVAALGAYYGIMLALNTAQAIQNGLKAVATFRETVHAAAVGMAAGATFTATAAQYGLNAALLACPVTWIVLAVLALVAAVVALVRGLDLFGARSTSVFGTFMGVLNVVWHFILNVLSGIWNAIGAVCSNIGTAFHNVIANVQGWFYGLLATALTVVEGICAALNKLPFVEFDYSGISAKADEYAAKSAEAYGNKETYTSVGDAFSSAWSDGWASDAFQAGATWGDSIADKVGGVFNLGAGDTGDYSGFDMSGMMGDVSSIAGDTGSMADSLSATDEELEYLRDIAERDAINRFTTAEVKIDMTGMTNKIDGGVDLDGVITELTDGFTAALVTAAEGVHE